MRAQSEDGGGSGKIFVQSPNADEGSYRDDAGEECNGDDADEGSNGDNADEGSDRDDGDEGSHQDDADSMLMRLAMVMGMMIAWLHIYHNHLRTFNFI